MEKKKKSRGNGQGSAYQDKKTKKWTAQVVIGWKYPDDPNKPAYPIKRRKKGFVTKKDAIAFCPTLLSGGYVKQKEAPRLIYYWEQYSKNAMLNIGKSKQCAYRIAWNRLKNIHGIKVDMITIETMQSVINKECSSFYTQKDCKTVLKHLLNMAIADGYITTNLSDFITLTSLEEKEQTPFTEEEQKSLWKSYENGDKNARIPLLMIYTGMMPGEAQMLQVSHINLENKTMYGMNLKTKVRKKTPVVIADCIIPVIQDLIADAQPSGYIFKRNETAWYQNYYSALETAKCRKLPPYSCRHTTATALAITEGIAPQTIKRVMRWSTTKMLDRYAHPQMTDALEAVNTIKGK